MTTVSSDSSAPPATASGERLAAVDLFRGLAIVAVVAHHLTGLALRHAEAGSALALGLAAVNRTLHFVVPAFVFMTALVLTRSALRRFDPGKYYWARVRTALLPYLLWTVLYVLFRVATGQDDPAALRDPHRWQVWVQYGKGYFHLYFLLIVLQFYLVLPLLLPLWRRRWPFLAVLLAAFAVQFAVYGLNRADILNFRFPGTMALWYVPALTLGMYFGANPGAFEALWSRWRGWFALAAGLALLWYVPVAVAMLRGAPVSSLTYSAANWTYTAAAVLALFGTAQVLAPWQTRWRSGLVYLGTVSLQIYLLHPAILWFLERLGFPQDTPGFLGVLVLYGLVALGVPVLVARLLEGTALSRWLFGR
ncbi:acyltransferase [Deinococcus apachensis]|uniref:acyltransferase n=1 Tax=Deinococcus apachensis TaxID=309886 RepID=UPI00036D8BED|nr:acyltransferase [Deinococcus apachensis]